MSKVEVLFFAADPLSADGYQRRLLLDEEVRQIREKVRAARHRDDLDFDMRWATRTDDLLQALNERQPDIVHFSGHGGSRGLVLVSADGSRPHRVDAPALQRLFSVFRGKIRVVLLNACTSLPQAQAIADAVGCAIGTPAKISDTAAIAFGASFYRAIAFGRSVQDAFDQACTALMLENFEEGEHPVLVTRAGVDASQLFFIQVDGEPVTPPVTPASRLVEQDATPASRPVEQDIAPVSRPIEQDVAPAPSMPVEITRPVLGAGKNRILMVLVTLAVSSGAVLAYATKPPAEPPIGSPCARARDVLAFLRQAHEAKVPSDGENTPRGLKGDATAGIMAQATALYDAGNYRDAFPLFKQAAVAGNSQAMGYVSEAYVRGVGTPPNPDSAGVWLEYVKATDDPRGMNALGEASERGFGRGQSDRWAAHWYRKSADAQFPEAMLSLARMYRDGRSVEESGELALQNYEKAAKAGLVDAMRDVAEMFEQGIAVARDPEAAQCWTAAEEEARTLR